MTFTDASGAGGMRNRCAFTSRDMGDHWGDAFTYAIVFGWDDDDPECDAMPEMAAKFGWDEPLIEFLRDAHRRFKMLPDKNTSSGQLDNGVADCEPTD